MPSVTKQLAPIVPLLQIAWVTKRNGQTRAAMVTLGGPAAALVLILSGVHLNLARLVRGVLAMLGVVR